MIKVRDLVPSIYYDESRDFQTFGRVFEVVFNYLKTNVDLVKENPLDRRSSINLIKLITKTLGFESKHEYSIDDLRTLCTVFIHCVRNKGTRIAIEDAVKALLHAQRIQKFFYVDIIEKDKMVNIYLPVEVTDVILLEDVLEYILPAGMYYNIIYGDVTRDNLMESEIVYEDDYKIVEFEDMQLGSVMSNDDERTTFSNLEVGDIAQTFTDVVISPAPASEENGGE